MPKGQLSRVPWPVNSWMLFTFQPALQVLQQPHKHLHSLQLANHTQLAYRYIQYALWTLSVFFLFVFQSTMWPYQSTEMALERAASHIKVTRSPGLFRLPPWEIVSRSTTLIYGTWVRSSHYLFMRKITWFRWCHASYLKSTMQPEQAMLGSRMRN